MSRILIKQIPKRPRLRPVCELGLPAGLFMGIGGLRGGKVGADGKMHYNRLRIYRHQPPRWRHQ
jgi:hypothetical protein